jgi:hypothetical protein
MHLPAIQKGGVSFVERLPILSRWEIEVTLHGENGNLFHSLISQL